MKNILSISTVVVIFLLAACGQAQVSAPPAVETAVPTIAPSQTAVPPTATLSAAPTSTVEPIPSQTPEPEATATQAVLASATPEGQIFRDDFAGALQPGWMWENENRERWTITEDGWLQILGEDPSLLYGQEQSNLLWRELPAGDFLITVHLKAEPLANFQQATIYLYQDLDNYIAINRGFCGPCVTGGNGIYMEYKISGQGASYMAAVQETDLYLRLEYKENVISGYYALAPDEWQRLGRFGNYFAFQQVGLGVTNCDREGDDNADLAGQFDYFELSLP